MDEPDELEPTITGRDSTPVPRRKESPIQLDRRIAEVEDKVHGPKRSIITDDQIDHLVLKISENVVAAVMERVQKESREIVRGHMGEVLKDLAFRAKVAD